MSLIEGFIEAAEARLKEDGAVKDFQSLFSLGLEFTGTTLREISEAFDSSITSAFRWKSGKSQPAVVVQRAVIKWLLGRAKKSLTDDRIFVFGSNKAGIHGAGAAAFAVQHRGAVHGRGEGAQGQSYAIPTKDERIQTLPIEEIRPGVERFVAFARMLPELRFQVTRIGCGLAGYQDEDIAPLFKNAPDNCDMPDGWRELACDVQEQKTPEMNEP